MAKNQPQDRSAKSYARVLIRQGFQEPAAYRLASIGLVGNASASAPQSLILPVKALTDWLRSDWLETRDQSLGRPHFGAYRLTSIGLVGNGAENLSSPFFKPCLPIGFDRISWKHRSWISTLAIVWSLTDWLRSDWLETQEQSILQQPSCSAYRLASIGLVGN